MNAGFAEGLDGAVVVENDANLAALAEQAASADGPLINAATLLMGERLGAGLIVDGRLLRGARGGAGEMRFLDVIFADSLLTSAEATAGAGALARTWAREAMRASDAPSSLRRVPEEHIQAEDVFHAAGEGDELAAGIIARLGSRLVRISLVLCSVLDVERIIVAGAIASAIEPVLVHARAELASDFYPPVPELAASTLGSEVVVKGAIESALARIRRNPLDFQPRG
jgi:predicted NBD/HSP70 family sugar kinase